MIYDKLTNFKLYPFNLSIWEDIFAFIQSINKDSEEKKYLLDNGIYAVVESYSTKPIEKAIFESHLKYIDIQWTIDGAEGINISPAN